MSPPTSTADSTKDVEVVKSKSVQRKVGILYINFSQWIKWVLNKMIIWINKKLNQFLKDKTIYQIIIDYAHDDDDDDDNNNDDDNQHVPSVRIWLNLICLSNTMYSRNNPVCIIHVLVYTCIHSQITCCHLSISPLI